MNSIFKKYFKNRNKELDLPVPSDIIKVLTDDAPKGFEYKDVGKGVCQLTPSSNTNGVFGKINIKGTVSVISPAAAKDIETIEELLIFADNMQQEVVISADNIALSIGNEKKLSKDILVNTRGDNKRLKWHKFAIEPKKLKKKIIISGFGGEIILNVEQKASSIWTVKIMETVDDCPLKLKWEYDIKLKKMKMNVLLSFKGKFSTQDILKYMKAYNAFYNKTAIISGINLFGRYQSGIVDEKSIQIIQNGILWWKRVEQIENALQVKFSCSMPLEVDAVSLLQRLYVGVVMKQIFKENVNLPEFKMKISDDFEKNEIKKMDMITILQRESLDILGVKKNIYKRIALFNFKVREVEKLNGNLNYLVKLKKESIDNVLEVTKYYLSENDVQEFDNKEMSTFYDVKYLNDILNEKV